MTTPAALYGQGISFPPRVGPDGGVVRSAGETNVRESVVTILRTRPGERVERPDFGCGLDRYLFEPNTVATLRLIVEDVQRAVTRWEPRIRLEDVTADVNATDPRDVDLTLVYTLIATGDRERLRMTLGAEGQDQP
ncbi:GPW/gp25 family protein [Streptomyces fuscichromogenes]|uniref:Baseplate protein n=1 Tax=Streptomyces fuscichromogenes TaxID=1324013 RepID=A0A917X9I7_9ACTN|nr:GPW/gp25 family protein [Streptomyces fuscichromogenes]GGM96384.1 baseplate protein [Streptomyces fuscichromogenes]